MRSLPYQWLLVGFYRLFSSSRSGMRGIALILVLLPVCSALLQAQPDSPQADSNQVDSTEVLPVDSTFAALPIDTLPPYPVGGLPLGSVRYQQTELTHDLHKEDLNHELTFSLFEPLHSVLPAYPLSQGAPGLVRTFSYAGSGELPILYNGRSLPGFELEMYSQEFIETVEVLQGAEAALYGGADALLALNVVQPRFDVAGSYMRLAYAQGAGSTNSDVSYARNIASRTNLVLGFRNVSSDGNYDNEEVSLWSARGSVMWRPSEQFTLSLSELFTDLSRGANGGITSASPVSPSLADVVNDSLTESNLRHDMTLAFQWYPNYKAADTTPLNAAHVDPQLRVDGSLFYTHAERLLEVREALVEIPGVATRTNVDRVGARVAGFVPLKTVNLHVNGLADVVNGSDGRIHVGGMAELVLSDELQLFAGTALTTEDQITTTSLFAEGRLSLSKSLQMRLTGRLFDDDAPITGIPDGAWSTERTRLMVEGQAGWSAGSSKVQLGGSLRQVATSGDFNTEYTLLAANASATIPIAFLSFEERLLVTVAPQDDKRFPLLYSRSDLYADFKLFKDNLDLRVGGRLEVQSPFTGSEYDYLNQRWLYPTDLDREERGLYPHLDFYTQGRIGSAYLKLALTNILGSESYTIYRYPYPGRSFRLGITWALID